MFCSTLVRIKRACGSGYLLKKNSRSFSVFSKASEQADSERKRAWQLLCESIKGGSKERVSEFLGLAYGRKGWTCDAKEFIVHRM